MDNVPSPIEVTSWPQVAALGLLLLAFVIVPAVIGYLQLRATKGATRTAEAAAVTAASAEENATKTLAAVTQNNGGKSMPDRFDKQDRYFAEIFDRLDKIEGIPRAVDVAGARPVELERGNDHDPYP